MKVALIDDLDGSPGDETVKFGLDGASYEIDLSADNARGLRDELEDYVRAARKVGGRRTRAVAVVTTPDPERRERNQEIRRWAQDQGLALSSRGRIPSHVASAFEEWQAAAQQPKPKRTAKTKARAKTKKAG